MTDFGKETSLHHQGETQDLSPKAKKLLVRAEKLVADVLSGLPKTQKDIHKTELVQEIYVPTRLLIRDIRAGVTVKRLGILLDIYERQAKKILAPGKRKN